MTDEQKIELLKSKFQQLIEASMSKDPKADIIFLSFFNAVKDNDALFNNLVDEAKTNMQSNIEKMQQTIADHEAKIAELDSVSLAKKSK